MNETKKQKRPCFICDGTGLMCDVCGESEAVCQCDDETMKSPCEDCEGTGIASADLGEEGTR